MADLAVSTIAQGLMWSILAIGVFLSFRVLDVPDMTCEGSFPLGGAIAASLIASGALHGQPLQPVRQEASLQERSPASSIRN